MEIPLSGDGGEIHVSLQTRLRGVPAEPMILTREQSKNSLPIYLTSGTAVVAGVAAAYFKIKADSRYNDYQQSGDPAALEGVHRYDTISGMALVTSEASILFLSYLLLSR